MNINIIDMEHYPNNGAIYKVRYTITYPINDEEASFAGSAYFSPDPNSASFVPYADLTEVKVAEWIVEYINNQAVVDGVKSGWQFLMERLHSQASQPASGLPWAAN